MSTLEFDPKENDIIVLYNKRSENYALWVGSKIIATNSYAYLYPYVIETGYSIEFISTKQEFLKYYDLIGVL